MISSTIQVQFIALKIQKAPMAKASKLPSYTSVQKALKNISSLASPAETHGLICGVLSAGNKMDGKSWLSRIMSSAESKDEKGQEARHIILELYRISFERLQSIEFDFDLLLPSDKKSLQERAEALTEWCEGYLTGLSLAGIDIHKGVSTDSQEVLEHMLEISSLDFEAIDVSEEDEKAFFDVYEYVRMSVILIHGEILEIERNQSNNPVGH